MTEMRHLLVQLSDDGGPQDGVLCELDFVQGRAAPPRSLAERGGRPLDWGAVLYEVSKEEISRVIADRPDYSAIRDDWDRPFRERRQAQDVLIAGLPADGQYGIIWEEGL